ncbi:MAG: (2Fe-2S)-binding protein [Proteobacteria bacterium]|nr:(2Fe-2S)-binding protein [Pseudomonadota bacterium]
MTQDNRLPAPHGLLIDRQQTLTFKFDGREYSGYAGDSIASALAANNVWLLSRSFKYHRPRGILTMAGQDANTMVQLPDEPNVLADREAIREGLIVEGQNYNGSLTNDRDMFVQNFARFLPVGFYYKAFYKPKRIWENFWEPYFRKKAGLGKVNEAAQEQYFDKKYEFCDIAIIGGGAAGLSAAAAAADAGADVILIDENPQLGGALNYARFDVEDSAAAALRQQLLDKIAGRVRVFSNAVCNGWFADHYLPVICGNRLHKIRAKQCIVAGGNIEQPLVFHNNDLPGIMQGSAAQRLIKLYGVRPGSRAVVATANSAGYGVCLDLLDAGVSVAAVADLRTDPPPHLLAQAVAERNVKIWHGHTVYEATPTAGHRHVSTAAIRPLSGRGTCSSGGDTLECDLICMSPGYMPAWQLPCQAGAQLGYDDTRAAFTLENLPQGFALAGAINNSTTLAAACRDGQRAVAALGYSLTTENNDNTNDEAAEEMINTDWHIFPHPRGKEFVDFDEDLQVADILNAAADGYDHVQLAKRYSTAGMGPSQGRHAALSVARLLASASGKSIAETGITTARPPFAAEKLGVMGGRHFNPERHTAMHQQHIALGAQFMPAGLWLRPAYYGEPHARQQCIEKEVLAVRNNVGMVDVSTLGGLEICGSDAGEFLNRIYTGSFTKQAVGRTRYVAMCNEQGVVIDDGVACRLHEQHYYVTATTSGVDNVYRNMLRWNAQWRLDVDISNVSAAWAAVNVAGVKAREVLQRAGCDIDLSAEAFSYMAVKTATVAGIPARLIRVGFVGEMGYEIHVPATFGNALWQALTAAGAEFNIQPFGVEAQRLLRLEKAHIIIGQDTDSMSFLHEVNLEWALAKNKPFFVGARAFEIVSKRPLQRRLVGFSLPADSPKPKEAHLVISGEAMSGRVTSCEYSPTLNKIIGMAYVTPQQTEIGTTINIRTDGGVMAAAQVEALPFYDAEGARQKL